MADGKDSPPHTLPPKVGVGPEYISAQLASALDLAEHWLQRAEQPPHLSPDLWEVPPLVRLDINSTRTSQGKQTSAEVDKRTRIFHPPPWTCPGAWGCFFSSWGSRSPRLSRCESELRGLRRWRDSLHLTLVKCFPH